MAKASSHPWRSTLAGCCVVTADFIHGWRWGRKRLWGRHSELGVPGCGVPAQLFEPTVVENSQFHNVSFGFFFGENIEIVWSMLRHGPFFETFQLRRKRISSSDLNRGDLIALNERRMLASSQINYGCAGAPQGSTKREFPLEGCVKATQHARNGRRSQCLHRLVV